jgi:integrase
MATLKFIIRGSKKDKPNSIYVFFRSGALRFYYPTKFKVLPKFWNAQKEIVKNTTEVMERDIINDTIRKIEPFIFKAYAELLSAHGYVDNDLLRVKMDGFLKRGENPSAKISFMEYFADYNEKAEKRIRLSTVRTYRTLYKNFKQYHLYRAKINFNTIDLDFYYNFIEFLEERNHSLNYIGKHIKVLKTVLNDATDEGINTNLAYKSKRFKVLREEVDNIYLTEGELKQFYDMPIVKEYDAIARDLFLIGAFTGLRVSDYTHLTEDNIYDNGNFRYIKKETLKTGRVVIIPLHPIVESILEKRDGTPPKSIPPQKINDIIKELGKQIGLYEMVDDNKTIGGLKVQKRVEKYSKICTHTARRSFCTNAYLNGMNSIDIMAISGHTTENNFLKYIKVTPLQIAERIAQHPFFKDAHLKVV